MDQKENNIKLQLNNKFKEIKDELEKYLYESNQTLISCYKILQANENYEINSINNSKIKTLYYISEIHKNNEISKKFLLKPIKNLDIYFDISNNTLNFKDYYINGIPIPKNIRINNIISKKIDISWDLDYYYIKGFDIDNVKYLIEIKNDKNMIFNYTVAKPFENYLFLDEKNFEENVEYEIKVRTIVDNYCSDWSEIKKFNINLFKKKNNKKLSYSEKTILENIKKDAENFNNISLIEKIEGKLFIENYERESSNEEKENQSQNINKNI